MNYLYQVLAYREKPFWKLVYWAARIGLAVTFIITGIRKFPGVKFTILPIENPVGFYFAAMHETSFYWNFSRKSLSTIRLSKNIIEFAAKIKIMSLLRTPMIHKFKILSLKSGTPQA